MVLFVDDEMFISFEGEKNTQFQTVWKQFAYVFHWQHSILHINLR